MVGSEARRCSRSSVGQVSEQLSSLSRDVLRLDRLLDRASASDHVGDATRIGILLALTSEVSEAELPLRVAQQRVRKLLLGRKRGVRFLRVEGDAEDFDAEFSELRGSITEPLALNCSARRRCLRIEPEHDAFSREVRRVNPLATVVASTKGRSCAPHREETP